MSTYPETLTNSTEPLASGTDPLAFAVVHAAIEELRECRKMIFHCVRQLSPSQIWSRPDEDQNAIGNLLLHLEGNLRQWIVVGLSESTDLRNRSREFSERDQIPAADLQTRLDRCVEDAIAVLNRMTVPTELLRPRRIQGFDVHGVAAIQHAVSHFRGHTQEIVGRTRQLLGKDYQFAWIPKNEEQGGPTTSNTEQSGRR